MKKKFDLGDDFSLKLAKAAAEADESLLIKLPEHDNCDHGVTFDEEAAKKLLEQPYQGSGDPMVDFVMGHPSTSEIRKRWPRLMGLCPKGCGYNGIAYASYAHYIYGDW